MNYIFIQSTSFFIKTNLPLCFYSDSEELFNFLLTCSFHMVPCKNMIPAQTLFRPSPPCDFCPNDPDQFETKAKTPGSRQTHRLTDWAAGELAKL